MLNPDFRDLLSTFIAEDVEFLVVGAYALAAHGVPRATGDLDVWIRRSPENAKRVYAALTSFGAPVDEIAASDFVAPDLIFQIGVEPNRIDILTSIDGVEFGAAWPGRLEAVIDGLRIPLLGAEDLLKNKRAAGRAQDLADASRLEAELARRKRT